MEGSQNVAEGSEIGAHAASVKTKSGCEDTILGQILPPPGGVLVIIFRKTPRIWPTIFCHPPQKKVGLHFGWTPQTRADARALKVADAAPARAWTCKPRVGSSAADDR